MENGTGASIGRRLRELRVWRGLSLREAAGLAGLSASYLSRIERGERAVDRRSTLEALAVALQVSPADLVSIPLSDQIGDPAVGAAQATLGAMEAVLSDVGYGDVGVIPRPWPEVQRDLAHLNEVLRPAADYAAQGAVLPGLIMELQALSGDPSAPRREVLAGLMDVYHAAAVQTKNLGARGLPALAAMHARLVAEELDEPAWLGLATWLRASCIGSGARDRMRVIAADGAEALAPHLDDPRARQMYGALHLHASMASATLRLAGDAQDHLDEARVTADALGPPASGRGFGNLYFGPDNVGIWRVGLAVEAGEPGRADEIAGTVVPARVPSAARQASYWAELGRGLSTQKATRERAVGALVKAESVAPVWVRSNPLFRGTVTELLRRARRDAGGRELRGIAYRMGVAG